MPKNGIVDGNAQNTASPKHLRTRSNFNLSYDFGDSHRFAEYHPFFVMESVPSDHVKLSSHHSVRSYTLKSPLMQSIQIKKDYFQVPMMAILPRNWDKFYNNPVRGEDCPADCGPTNEFFWNDVYQMMSKSWTYLRNKIDANDTTDTVMLHDILLFLVFGEYFYSNGSLMKSLGISGSQFVRITSSLNVPQRYSWDRFFDALMEPIRSMVRYFQVSVDNSVYHVYPATVDHSNSSVRSISFREFLDLIRETPIFTLNNVTYNATNASFQLMRAAYQSLITAANPRFVVDFLDSEAPLNLSRIYAYQLVCFHFYTNDHIDFVFSADLYREYLEHLAFKSGNAGYQEFVPFFTMNGMNYEYDVMSARVEHYCMARLSGSDGFYSISQISGNPFFDNLNDAYAYFAAIFSYRRSLRFLDYFTGSRSQPLAVGNVDVTVGQNGVNVIDMVRQTQLSRFLNAVNRAGSRAYNYVKELFGVDMKPDFHNPLFLGHVSDSVVGQESEYTGNVAGAQAQNVSSVLRSNGSRYAFEFDCDRPSVLIGIAYYDIKRFYARAIERQALHVDRFDMFNPFMQFIGDQSVENVEVGTDDPAQVSPFAYQLRHMEYKQRFAQVAGALADPDVTPGWIYRADGDSRQHLVEDGISPEYIRSSNSELDQFYVNLTGYALGTYFHFLIESHNECSASRPMAYAPSIL